MNDSIHPLKTRAFAPLASRSLHALWLTGLCAACTDAMQVGPFLGAAHSVAPATAQTRASTARSIDDALPVRGGAHSSRGKFFYLLAE